MNRGITVRCLKVYHGALFKDERIKYMSVGGWGMGKGYTETITVFLLLLLFLFFFKRTLSSFYGIPVNLQALDTR